MDYLWLRLLKGNSVISLFGLPLQEKWLKEARLVVKKSIKSDDIFINFYCWKLHINFQICSSSSKPKKLKVQFFIVLLFVIEFLKLFNEPNQIKAINVFPLPGRSSHCEEFILSENRIFWCNVSWILWTLWLECKLWLIRTDKMLCFFYLMWDKLRFSENIFSRRQMMIQTTESRRNKSYRDSLLHHWSFVEYKCYTESVRHVTSTHLCQTMYWIALGLFREAVKSKNRVKIFAKRYSKE